MNSEVISLSNDDYDYIMSFLQVFAQTSFRVAAKNISSPHCGLFTAARMAEHAQDHYDKESSYVG